MGEDHSKAVSANHLWSPQGYHHLLTLRMYKDIIKCNIQVVSEETHELVVFDVGKDHSKVMSANHLWSRLLTSDPSYKDFIKCNKQVVSVRKELVVFDGRKDHSKAVSANHL